MQSFSRVEIHELWNEVRSIGYFLWNNSTPAKCLWNKFIWLLCSRRSLKMKALVSDYNWKLLRKLVHFIGASARVLACMQYLMDVYAVRIRRMAILSRTIIIKSCINDCPNDKGNGTEKASILFSNLDFHRPCLLHWPTVLTTVFTHILLTIDTRCEFWKTKRTNHGI